MSAEIIRLVILLVVFAAVFLLATVGLNEWSSRRTHTEALNKRLSMIASGASREAIVGELIKSRPQDIEGVPEWLSGPLLWFQRMIFATGINATSRLVLILLVSATVIVFFLSLMVLALVGTAMTLGVVQLTVLFALALGFFVPILVLQRMAQIKRKKIEQQFPVALDIFVRALRTGHPVASAIDLLTKEMEDPIGSEFGLISDEVAYGADLIDALTAMGDRWQLEDIRMFVVSLALQQQTGGNLAEILENLAKVIRDRAQMFMKVRALSSEGRMTGWMLTVLPILAFISIFLVAPSYYIEIADDFIFQAGMITLLVMYCLGVYTIRRLIDLKV